MILCYVAHSVGMICSSSVCLPSVNWNAVANIVMRGELSFSGMQQACLVGNVWGK